MRYAALTGLSRKRLASGLLLLFFALLIPSVVLIAQAYSQLKWEAFYHHQQQAKALAGQVDARLSGLISREEKRPFTAFHFLVVEGDASNSFLQRSPLSSYPVDSAIPGLIGFFQVDADGQFSSPLLPQQSAANLYGLSDAELGLRRTLHAQIQQILSDNRLVQQRQPSLIKAEAEALAKAQARRADEDAASRQRSTQGLATRQRAAEERELAATAVDDAVSEPVPVQAQAAFDQLNEAPLEGLKEQKRSARSLGRVEDLKLEYSYRPAEAEKSRMKSAPSLSGTGNTKGRLRREVNQLPEAAAPATLLRDELNTQETVGLRITTFESEVDGFELSLLDSGHLVLFRKVWRDGQRYIQGALIEQGSFINGVVGNLFQDSTLAQMSDLIVAYQGDVLSAFTHHGSGDYLLRPKNLSGELLYQSRLSAPLSGLQLLFSIRELPAGPGGKVIYWVAAILVIVLCAGFYLIYRLGIRQIEVAEQQQDFVSAVSHELKTPLTSIRMYSEMLREGWAPEEKRRGYYDFIHDESERLSRLINNVLQLARMTRNRLPIEVCPISVGQLVDGIRSKVSSQVERVGFRLDLSCDEPAAETKVEVDEDAFSQVIINLVDNALKFSAKAEKRVVEVTCSLQQNGAICIAVRDYGPGIPRDQMKKIFRLFYRSESEMTRETIGTGIGLALVNQLVIEMGGKVDLVNREPGAEFSLIFPCHPPK